MDKIIVYFVLFLVAVIPVIILGYYVNKYDTNKEPIKMLVKLFIYGTIIVLPCFFMELNLITVVDVMRFNPNITFFVSNYIVIALSEELWKCIALFFAGYHSKYFDEVYDGILYGAFVALGFACVENIAYVFSYGIETGLARAFLAVPSHVCNGIIMGYFLSLAKKSHKKKDKLKEIQYILLSFIVPTIVHGTYDLLASLETSISYVILAIIVIIIVIVSTNIIQTVSRKKEAI